jgi:tetratricopeptide (TPR) repeat protein
MTLMAATAGRLFELILIGGVGLAVVIYIIRKQLRNPQNEPVKVIGLWVLSFIVFVGIAYSAVAAQEGVALLFVIFVGLPIAVLVGVAWTPTIANMLVSPLTTAFSGDDSAAYEGPAYGQALANRKRGRYDDAVEAVEAQLERYPGDFDGLMLKASIQAENLDDLLAAITTIQETLDDPEKMRFNLPVALNKIADWQLTIAGDAPAAKRTLQQIREVLPGTQAAQFASQRLASLDASEESEAVAGDINESYRHLAEESAAKDDFTGPLEIPRAVEVDPLQTDEAKLQTCLRRVALHPDSINNREELAALYLNHARKPELAIQQYEHLLTLPGTTIHQKTAWLNRVADIQIKSGETYESIRATLGLIISLDPKAAPAVRAEQRIAYLRIEIRGANKKSKKLQLGSYDEDVGLKS